MYPHVGPLPGHLIGWIVGTALASISGVWLMRRDGIGTRWAALSVASLALVVYATGLRRLGTPGWILLTIIVGVPLARVLGLRFLHMADVVAPAGGLLIFGGRIGCFLAGCCFGTPSSLPWAVRFPPGSRAYRWQLANDQIWFGTTSSLPVHPLQLYFAGLGLLLFTGLMLYRPRRRYQGEVLLLFSFIYLLGTWLLEHLRAEADLPKQHTLLLGAAAISVVFLRPRNTRRHGLSLTT
ncbi:MAG: prolipoprotein diacylglyceryl transferase [Deltaproteobacteria bacterium]|nr:prolipoprotein diacylglyceryl transferase [Deltaproteobacteria bacterium]